MSVWGKLLGAGFGYMLGGPIGAILGAFFGHQFDKGLSHTVFQSSADIERIQASFFTTLFSVMGHLAKADGRVSETEIAMARSVMQQMSLDEEQKRIAIDLFNKGKQADFPLDRAVQQFRRECHGQRNLIQMFMEVLLHAAYADGVIKPQEEKLLKHIAHMLRISPAQLARLEAMVQAQQSFHQGSGGHRHTAKPNKNLLNEAYIVLGVTKSASDAEIKKAYRRQMNQHHPDKLVARGMPEEMIKMATEKTQEIKAAYDTIQKARQNK
ncbi:MAG: co-chaperone DjlA [Gammaproteobacteria bacterium]|nr:co-chaperone DjlA [Gammaproteobacteria bacterium]MDH5777436.1 co-chaperone DjlA [Gammaproteobacteria bacterium]